MSQREYEKLLTDIIDDIVEAYIKWDRLDKYTLTIIGEDILYMYAMERLGYAPDKALDFSIKYFNQKIEERRN